MLTPKETQSTKNVSEKLPPGEVTPAKKISYVSNASASKKIKLMMTGAVASPVDAGSINPGSVKKTRSREVTPKSKDVTPKSKDATPRGRSRTRLRKRKRSSSNSSSDDDLPLPENAVETDRRLNETAERNNLTQDSVKKILKKVVTNDHVLALVALREEEEAATELRNEPKITRAKAKELTKTSPDSIPGTVPWKLELTPIKHIPVKTTPEVTALIAQELPDESDEEYHPNNDDVLSDDDQTLESCSDVDSQPHTPATPASLPPASPPHEPLTDGPFKVPMTPVKRDEEATIALRTRSKLCLSSTSIEHIESSFVPPDEPPQVDVDHLWSDFLQEVLDPNITSFRPEDDDDADPEYNVAADQEADDEDDALERSLVNISRKELDDLYNELMGYHVPEPIPVKIQPDEERTEENHTGSQYLDLDNQPVPGKHKVEAPRMPIPMKEEQREGETERDDDNDSQFLVFNNQTVPGEHDKLGEPRMPIPMKEEAREGEMVIDESPQLPRLIRMSEEKRSMKEIVHIVVSNKGNKITDEVVCEKVQAPAVKAVKPPKLIRRRLAAVKPEPQKVNIVLSADKTVIEPGQVLILEQQLRQHIQLITSSYLQIYVHPRLWRQAPPYKEYLVGLNKIADERAAKGQRSVVEVCNLRPALDLVNSWEESLSEDTPQNQDMVKFLEKETERCMRRGTQNVVYNGSFSPMYMEVIANSSVFVYPYLLPPIPFRCDEYRRTSYLPSEDSLIAMGLEQFYEFVAKNKNIYRMRKGTGVCLSVVTGLIVKHMTPWFRVRSLQYHIQVSRRSKNEDHPIRRFFERRGVEPVQHKLLAFNPSIDLHQQPVYEMPLQWARFISQHCDAAKQFVMSKEKLCGHEPNSVEIDIENRKPAQILYKKPRRFKPNKESAKKLAGINFTVTPLNGTDKEKNPTLPKILPKGNQPFQLPNGGFLLPVMFLSADGTVNCASQPILATRIAESEKPLLVDENSNASVTSKIYFDEDCNNPSSSDLPVVEKENLEKSDAAVLREETHCKCCHLMKKLEKKWSLITNYFTSGKKNRFDCCVNRKFPKVNRRLKSFISSCSTRESRSFDSITSILNVITPHSNIVNKDWVLDNRNAVNCQTNIVPKDDLESLQEELWATWYLCKLAMSTAANAGRQILQLVETFREDRDDPVKLYTKLCELVPDELKEELVTILSSEQADRVKQFPRLFTRKYLKNFTALLKAEVKDENKREQLLAQTVRHLSLEWTDPCELCCLILNDVGFNRPISEFVFNAIPHKRTRETMDSCGKATDEPDALVSQDNPPVSPKVVENELKKCDTPKTVTDTTSAVNKIEVEEEDENEEDNYVSVRDMTIEHIKTEVMEWSRVEDKIILETIKCHFVSGLNIEGFLVLLEDNEVYEELLEKLPDKSKEDIETRIKYLMNILQAESN